MPSLAPQLEVPGAPQSAKRPLVSPANTSSSGFHHPDYPAENHVSVRVLSRHLIEIVPIPVSELRRQRIAQAREVRRRQEAEQARQAEEVFYARAASFDTGRKRSRRRGKGRRRHQRG